MPTKARMKHSFPKVCPIHGTRMKYQKTEDGYQVYACSVLTCEKKFRKKIKKTTKSGPSGE